MKTILYPTKMTSNTIPSPYVVSSSSMYDATYDAWKAFNGTISGATDAWATANNARTGWIQIDFGVGILANKVSITNRNNTIDSDKTSPKDFSILGSNDGVNFNNLLDVNNQIWTNAEVKEYEFPNKNSYRYYKINITANNGQAYVSIGNILFSKVEKINFIIKNTTNQHYSLADKTLIHLPSLTKENIALYGIEYGKEVLLDEPFDKIKYINETSEVLDEGKIFTHTFNLNEIKIKKIHL